MSNGNEKRRLKPLDSIGRRDLLANPNASPDLLRAYAEHYLEQGALDEAFSFFSRAGDEAGVDRVKREAIERGNTYLLFRVADSGRGRVAQADWAAAGERAMSLGKYAYAAQAFRRAGLQERQEEAARHLPAAAAAPPFQEKKDPGP